MPNLDLSIAKIMQGDTPVLRIMEGDTRVWPSGTDVAIDGVLTNVTSSMSIPGTVALNSSLTITLAPNSSCIMNQISVTMGGIDITSTAYNEGVITIASVTSDVIIHASAIEVITFEDANVKAICVENWGGNVIEGEITPAEAAAVTTLDGKFYNNKEIVKFNELRYFTGLTSLYYKTVSGYAHGQLYGCTLLEEVTIPVANINSFSGAFRECPALKEIDITPTTATQLYCSSFAQLSQAKTQLKKIKIPGVRYMGNIVSFVNRRYGLTTIEIDGVADWSNISNYTSAFYYCNALTTITGAITGINAGLSFANSPLTRESALVILNGLAPRETNGNVTFSTTTKNLLTDEDRAIATNKGWTIV